MDKKIRIKEIKGLNSKEVALMGNVNPVLLVLAECNIKEYLKYRIILINDKTELEELKRMYSSTDWWKEVINDMKKR